ncbi:MAG: hypothetical protein GY913_29965, partial [Proteobacteria bacterium]|nr:hypothetical protein [Pseudomonadota bacterium]
MVLALIGLVGAEPTLVTAGSGSTCLVSLHENESTAFHAGHVRSKAGDVRFIAIEEDGERLVTFGELSLDPNRMFTRRGIEASAQTWSERLPTEDELAAVEAFAAQVMTALEGCTTTIALHNNWDAGTPPDPKDLSVLTYRNSEAARRMHREPDQDVDDFVLVTREEDFTALKEAGISVVLQNPSLEDDGSLSFVLRDARYLNVEAEHGHGGWQRGVL